MASITLTRAQIETIGQLADGLIDGAALVGPHEGGDRWQIAVALDGTARLRDVEGDYYIESSGGLVR